MIITRAPFRVSFCGGGSDIPVFYKEYGGCVLSTTIKKYMYLAIHKYFFANQIVLKYSKTESVDNYGDIKHKYFKRALEDFEINGVEISSMADIPAGTGLGSSSSFTVALLHLLHTYKGEFVSKYKLANDACEMEIDKLGGAIGKQDQFAAAFGGLNYYEFRPNGHVIVEPIIMNGDCYKKMEDNIMMFYLGGKHDASSILKEQNKNIKNAEKAKTILRMCELTKILKEELQNNNVDALGELLHENWALKKSMASGISNFMIDEVYEKAITSGAKGGKLLGAGGAGFMIFYVKPEKQEAVRKALRSLKEMDFRMDNSGASIVHFEENSI